MSEKAFVRRLVARLRKAGFFVQRIEDAVSAGIPDIYAVRDGRSVWIEAKYLPRLPVRQTTPVRLGLREAQVIWIEDAVAHGAEVYIAAMIGRREMWFSGRDVRALARGCARQTLFGLVLPPLYI